MNCNTNSFIITLSFKKDHKNICDALIQNYKKVPCDALLN